MLEAVADRIATSRTEIIESLPEPIYPLANRSNGRKKDQHRNAKRGILN